MIQLIKPFPPPLSALHSWEPGDQVTHLDGKPLEDILDLYYYTPEGRRTELRLRRRDGAEVVVRLDPADIGSVTECFAPMEFKTCGCDCVFCFIDQNPGGTARIDLYVKDEDYRLSFLYGNYITLTLARENGLEPASSASSGCPRCTCRCTPRTMSPRNRLLGIKQQTGSERAHRAAAAGGIDIHTQVVLCPGWNDGAVLSGPSTTAGAGGSASGAREPVHRGQRRGYGLTAAHAVADLTALTGRSLAIVPVGLAPPRGLIEQVVTPKAAGSSSSRPTD